MTPRLSKLVLFDVLEEVSGQCLFGLGPIYNNDGMTSALGGSAHKNEKGGGN